VGASRSDIKESQKQTVGQLLDMIADRQDKSAAEGAGPPASAGGAGPPTRVLIAKCLTTLFTVGDAFLLFEAINRYARN
jgi:hypothetical protein